MQYSVESLREYEMFLESLKLSPDLFKIKDVEMDLKKELNPSHCLDDLFFKQMKWLSFEDFFEFYFNRYKDIIMTKFSFSSYESFKEGLRARLYRTQFGFLTEYHAFFLASILFGNGNVKRSTGLDLAGVDFQVSLNNNTYNIHIFVDTERAWSYRNYKSIHKKVNSLEGVHVNLPYSLKANRFNSLRFLNNKFGVYTESYLRYFETEATHSRIKSNNIIGTNAHGFIYSC